MIDEYSIWLFYSFSPNIWMTQTQLRILEYFRETTVLYELYKIVTTELTNQILKLSFFLQFC